MTIHTCLTIFRAVDVWSRLGGLLVRPPLSSGQALYLAPCTSVHTLFMRYSIDLAFVDRQGTVLKLVCSLRPWRVAGCWGAHGTVELLAGELAQRRIDVGDEIDLHARAGART